MLGNFGALSVADGYHGAGGGAIRATGGVQRVGQKQKRMPKCGKMAERKMNVTEIAAGARHSRRRAQIIQTILALVTMSSMSVSGNSGGSVRRGDENRPCRPGLAGARLLRAVERPMRAPRCTVPGD